MKILFLKSSLFVNTKYESYTCQNIEASVTVDISYFIDKYFSCTKHSFIFQKNDTEF